MSVIVFGNVGARDVWLPDDPDKKTPPARIRGQKIRDDLAAGRAAPDDLRFPILQPSLDFILQRETAVDQLILIGTDQALADTAERFWNTDTLHYAYLAQTVLAARYGDRIGTAVVELVGQEPFPINPSLLDEALRVYGPLLEKYGGEETAVCYLLASGGIPSLNTALLLHGIQRFGERCRVVYQSQGGNPWLLPVGRQVLDMNRRQTARQFLDRYDFSGAYQTLAAREKRDDSLLTLLRYANARLWFDFNAARLYIEQALAQATGAEKTRLRPLLDSLNGLSDAQNELTLIAELYFNALIAWENHRFVDFLGRAVRFQEAVTEFLAAELIAKQQLSPYFTPEALRSQPVLQPILLDELARLAQTESGAARSSMNAELAELRLLLRDHFTLEELRSLCIELGILYEDLPGEGITAKARELIDYAVRRGRFAELHQKAAELRPAIPLPETPAVGRLGAIVPVLQRLGQLAELRENSIIGHGFAGASRELIQAQYAANAETAVSPIQEMALVCAALDTAVTNPFHQVQAFVRERLA